MIGKRATARSTTSVGFCRLTVLQSCWLLLLVVLAASGQDRTVATDDDFETAETSWRVVRSDCRVQTLAHERTPRESHRGGQSEWISFHAGHGTYIYAAHPIAPSRVIPELTPRLWVKSDRSDAQLLARVVFPQARDQRGQPVTALVRGDFYEAVGRWQVLTIPQIELAVERRVRALRAELQVPVDDVGAYIDLLVLNLYGDAGTTNVWIDDLTVEGVVRADLDLAGPVDMTMIHDGTPRTASAAAIPWKIENNQLLMHGRSFFAQVAFHHQESFDSLQRLGFNTIWLSQPATVEQLRVARLAGLWLVCPPPEDFDAWDETPQQNGTGDEVGHPTERNSSDISQRATDGQGGAALPLRDAAGAGWDVYDRVLAWDINGPNGVDTVLARRLRKADPWRRPLATTVPRVAPAAGDPTPKLDPLLAGATGIADIVVPFGGDVVRSNADSLAPGGSWSDLAMGRQLPRPVLLWYPLPIDPDPATLATLKRAAIRYELPPPRVHYIEVKNQMYRALLARVDGICIAAGSSIEAKDEVATYRRAVVELLNREAAIVAPWAMLGETRPIYDASHAPVHGLSFLTGRSQLLLIDADAPAEEDQPLPVPAPSNLSAKESALFPPPRGAIYQAVAITAPPAGRFPAEHNLGDTVESMASHLSGERTLVIPAVEAVQVYLVNQQRLSPLPFRRVSGGVEFRIQKSRDVTALLLLQDTIVVERIAQKLRALQPRTARLLFEVTSAETLTLHQVHSRLRREMMTRPELDELRVQLKNLHDQAHAGLQSRDFVTAQYAASQSLAIARHMRQMTRDELVRADRYQASPFLRHFETYPLQVFLSCSQRGLQLSPREFRAYDFENLSEMLHAGWREKLELSDGARARIELVPDAPRQGQYCLQLRIGEGATSARGETGQRQSIVIPPRQADGRQSIQVQSPTLTVYEGDIIRVRGWWRYRNNGSGAVSQVLVRDLHEIELLDHPLLATDGWQQFELLHVADRTGPWGFSMQLSGGGELSLDDFAVEVLGE